MLGNLIGCSNLCISVKNWFVTSPGFFHHEEVPSLKFNLRIKGRNAFADNHSVSGYEIQMNKGSAITTYIRYDNRQ